MLRLLFNDLGDSSSFTMNFAAIQITFKMYREMHDNFEGDKMGVDEQMNAFQKQIKSTSFPLNKPRIFVYISRVYFSK